jgi:oxaloacetate decarboxylase gamma subunit
MIGEGFELMLVGMGVVFCFLVLLVVVLNLTGAFFQKYSDKFPDPVPEAPPANGGNGGPTRPAGDTNAKVAVALAAAYRARKGA